MILVDTSVLIDFFRGLENRPTRYLRELIRQQTPFGISSVIYQEVLQGANTEKEYAILDAYLSSQRFYHPLDAVSSFAEAARLYFICRKKGITVRSTIDCLIAQIAVEHDLFLLHNDKDFDIMAPVIGLNLCIPDRGQ